MELDSIREQVVTLANLFNRVAEHVADIADEAAYVDIHGDIEAFDRLHALVLARLDTEGKA
jgi:hypothetical protein